MGQYNTEKVIEESVAILYGSETLRGKRQGASTNSWWQLWGQPVILFGLILTGLIGALVKNGWWDLFFCLLLIYPLYKITKHYYRSTDNKASSGDSRQP